jgi:hypothetical protein
MAPPGGTVNQSQTYAAECSAKRHARYRLFIMCLFSRVVFAFSFNIQLHLGELFIRAVSCFASYQTLYEWIDALRVLQLHALPAASGLQRLLNKKSIVSPFWKP